MNSHSVLCSFYVALYVFIVGLVLEDSVEDCVVVGSYGD
jgi:hypothetical protein